ncbi:hypothetical protein CCAX7_54040 [Capsulimonas corticalis]|uniref:Uncharacterized protein n=1 Tax=Capsulimonas corticalis TaxID=2219043 RepID=A0A402CNF3_9BACT|nr:hypothetical protein [Capsulimonas corticalis]BDI33353.1 hypothetical protein CCAX7_54040 [Capsulimonas corticalis]
MNALVIQNVDGLNTQNVDGLDIQEMSMAEIDVTERYRATALPLAPSGGQVPEKFMKVLKAANRDEDMRVYTVNFRLAEPGENDQAERANESKQRGSVAIAGTAMVLVEFGEAKVVAWNKPALELLEHEAAFEEMALRAVTRAGDD